MTEPDTKTASEHSARNLSAETGSAENLSAKSLSAQIISEESNSAASISAAGISAGSVSEQDHSEEAIGALVAGYEAKIDEVLELVARVRHEINNPLAGVLGQAQLLLREELSEKARKRAETIEELAFRLRDVVAQLRQVQKPIKGPEN